MNIREIADIMSKAKKIHFVGIGGISMSSLAAITKTKGYTVTGSDRTKSAMTERLSGQGITVYYCHSEENVLDSDVIVYTAAVNFENPELKKGLERKIPLITRGEYLGWLMSEYKCRIGVSGTHGKSTVTSMLTEIYLAGKYDPTVVSGAELSSIGGAYHLGSENYFIFEACEYCDSFLSFCPTTAVVTNLEYDHADYFKTMDQLRASFRQYVGYGSVAVLNADDDEARALKNGYDGKAVTFSACGKGDYNAENVVYNGGCASFDLTCHGEKLGDIMLTVPGVHNVYNALAAAASALENGADMASVKAGLYAFGGAKRRFEYKGKTETGAEVYIDYAHHPSEIKVTLNAAKTFGKRVVTVFQPHTYSRTASLFDDFTASFRDSDITLFADIYAARETDTLGVSSELLASKTPNGTCLSTFENIAEYLKNNCDENDIIMILGAGDVIKIADMIV
ncbi:MAG: UDP-N-acetylmuramate--L-alanine ligase [Clostridia bacterium]|nr:UDP-N-acetylmuramate--L-alanine ligase [Clostridia bacterium]